MSRLSHRRDVDGEFFIPVHQQGVRLVSVLGSSSYTNGLAGQVKVLTEVSGIKRDNPISLSRALWIIVVDQPSTNAKSNI
jgi:hypothetical protein